MFLRPNTTIKQIVPLLKQHQKLLTFVKGLFHNVKQTCPHGENITTSEQRISDAFARLFVGDETCCAIAISGEKLLLTTNRHLHRYDKVKYQRHYEILEKIAGGLRYIIRFTDTLIYQNPGEPDRHVKKTGEAVTYQFILAEQKFRLIEGSTVIKFSQEEHGINFFDDNTEGDFSINTSLKTHKEIFNMLHQLPTRIQFPLILEPLTLEIDPLKRRSVELLQHIATIAHAIITRPDMQETVHRYQAQHKYWPSFLANSLTYEMSIRHNYKDYIRPFMPNDLGTNQMLDFYKWLVDHYGEFKKNNECSDSLDTIKSWFSNIKENICSEATPAPGFIKAHPQAFLEKAERYFVDLITIETYVTKDAKERGVLSQLLIKENIFQSNTTVEIIDGIEDFHAEMRLLEYHLTYNRDADYYGITMLCCGLCAYTLQQLQQVEQLSVGHFRGSNGVIYPGWQLLEIIKEQYLEQFLGTDLYEYYLTLKEDNDENKCYPPGKKMIPANQCQLSDIALELIAYLGKFQKTHFNELDIPLDDFPNEAKGMALYPDEDENTPHLLLENTSTNYDPNFFKDDHQHNQQKLPDPLDYSFS